MKKLERKNKMHVITDESVLNLVHGGMASANSSLFLVDYIIPKKPPKLPLEPTPKN